MINSLTLINYESHRHNHFEFVPGLNIFIGLTSAGKSGALRGLGWVQNNRPLGDGMRPLFWKGTTEVVVDYSDPDVTVSRLKGKKINDYKINNQKPINAGSGPPPDIVVQSVLMDDINFQSQADRSFMMFETSGERGKILNRVAGLEEIDRGLDNSKKDVARLKKEYEEGKKSIVNFEKQLESFSDLDEIETKVALCIQFDQYIKQAEKKASTYRTLIKESEEIESKLEVLEEFLEAEEKLGLVESLLREIQEKEIRIDSLREITQGIESIEAQLEDFGDLDKIESKLEEVAGLNQQIETAEGLALDLRSRVKKLKRIKSKMDTLEDEINELEDKLPEICKACGATIK